MQSCHPYWRIYNYLSPQEKLKTFFVGTARKTKQKNVTHILGNNWLFSLKQWMTHLKTFLLMYQERNFQLSSEGIRSFKNNPDVV